MTKSPLIANIMTETTVGLATNFFYSMSCHKTAFFLTNLCWSPVFLNQAFNSAKKSGRTFKFSITADYLACYGVM